MREKEVVNPTMVNRGLAAPMKVPVNGPGISGGHAGAALNLKPCIVQIQIMEKLSRLQIFRRTIRGRGGFWIAWARRRR